MSHPQPTAPARRDPDATRIALLEAAFEEIHVRGFRGASLDNILARTGVTKGALYHHFPNKTALGYAVVDEVIVPHASQLWARLEDRDADPIDTLLTIGRESLCSHNDEQIALGCPVNNLVHEMAPLDEGFRQRLNQTLVGWRDAIEAALKRGQAAGVVNPAVDAAEAAAFLVAGYEGSLGLAKSARSTALLETCLAGMATYLEMLRHPAAGA